MAEHLEQEVDRLVERQLRQWPEAAARYAALDHCDMRLLDVDGSTVVLQHNPARRRSASAPVNDGRVPQRPCFLCRDHQPPEQEVVLWHGRYKLQVNPFPIFERHLTVADLRHTPQRLDARRLVDLIDLAEALPGWQLFYNGARCGASAPDHFHFQAVAAGAMPLPAEVQGVENRPNAVALAVHDDGRVTAARVGGRPCLVATASDKTLLQYYCGRILLALVEATAQDDPMVNVLCRVDGRQGTMVVIPRRRHRPACYGEGAGQLLLSPGSTEMAGWWAVARDEDYRTLTAAQVAALYSELCVDNDTFKRITNSFTQYTND